LIKESREVIKDKRKGEKPIPNDIHNYLNEAQDAVLNKIQEFGWSLQFIRRPLFREPIVIAANAKGDAFGVLEVDGHFNTEPDILLRE
jgi:hypothetical protein